MSPEIYGRWLPVRLPAISLATLMFEYRAYADNWVANPAWPLSPGLEPSQRRHLDHYYDSIRRTSVGTPTIGLAVRPVTRSVSSRLMAGGHEILRYSDGQSGRTSDIEVHVPRIEPRVSQRSRECHKDQELPRGRSVRGGSGRFRGNVVNVAAATIVIRSDALLAADADDFTRSADV
jgi:hypothetical protein